MNEQITYDYQDEYEHCEVMATYWDDEAMIQEVQIGSVTLKTNISTNDMPTELRINGTIYKKED